MYGNDYENQNNNGYVSEKSLFNTEASSQGRGTYTDYIGYGSSGSSGTGAQPPEIGKGNKGKVIAGCIALVLAGLLAGAGVSYAYLNARSAGTQIEASAQASEETDAVALQKSQESTTEQSTEQIGQQTAHKTTGSSESMIVSEIAQKCLSSVVAITNIGETEIKSMWGTFTQESESAGSGIIIGETDEELLILTNYHVVSGNNELSVVFSWEEGETAEDTDIINAVIKDYDANKDIAVIAVRIDALSEETLSGITIATVGNSDNLQLGEQVVAIGNALGYGQSVTTGIVSALNREVTTTSGTETSSDAAVSNTYIQTDAAINPGNSGGALFNMKGELVGVNSAKIGGTSVEGMGYAIPVSSATPIINELMNKKTRVKVDEAEKGYLGIQGVDVTSEVAETYSMPMGVYVAAVVEGTAADDAGLVKGDIITAFDGNSITSMEGLQGILEYYAAGTTVDLTVERASNGGYEKETVSVTLGERTAQ